MAKRKKKNTRKDKERTPIFDDLSPQVKQSIAALLIASVGVFFLLALLEMAGMVGGVTKTALTKMFGGGAWFVPIVCAAYTITFLMPREDNSKVSKSKMFGIGIFFISILGLMELNTPEFGGYAGLSVKWPLDYLIGGVATGFFLSALLIIGTLLTINRGLGIPAFLRRKEQTEEELEDVDEIFDIIDSNDDSEEEADDEGEGDEEQEKPAKKRRGLGQRIGITKDAEDFVVTSFIGAFDPPPLTLLNKDKGKAKNGDTKANANTIKRTLKEFGINVEMDAVEVGPTVTRYSLKPAQGVKLSRIVGLQGELELNLASGTIRIEAPIPGKSLVGIEVPNIEKASIGLATLLASPEYTDSPKPLYVALGKDITGHPHFANMARMPHALIAGTTGSGKSVAIHNLIISLLFRNSPEQLRFIMVDPKRVELTLYDGIPHLMTPVITNAKKVLQVLSWAVKEMERRYDILQSEKEQNVESYHDKIYYPAKKEWEKNGSLEEEKQMLPESMPYIVIVMDELADLMQAYPRELEALIVRLAQMSRAVGIHLLLATQRPSVNVITGTIKANIPTRMALQVNSQIDSRTILDQPGAEKLLGKGDMLFMSSESGKPTRLQSAFISNEEIKSVVSFLKKQGDAHDLEQIDLEPEGNSEGGIFAGDIGGDDDELIGEAQKVIIESGKASTSYLQRRMRIGYSRASRIMDQLEERGVIGPQDGSRPREILIGKEDEYLDDDESEYDGEYEDNDTDKEDGAEKRN